jgi:cytosine/adenosine deaminase-related metal-dependent hydrolase/C-terminal processing protease CtpA/Prc
MTMADRYVLDGRVVTMNADHDVHDPGRVYVDGSTIVAVGPASDPAPDGFAGAPVVRTGDTLYPGLIELHNHLSYNALPLWQVPQRFDNRGQWMRHREYRRFVSGPASVLGRTGGFLEAVVRYVESKCLLGGVTTSQGIALASNMGIRRFYKGLVRNVEDTDDDALPAAGTRVADVEAADAQKFLRTLNRSSSLLLHLAEGVDQEARDHFRSLRIGKDEWAITPSLAGIHCAGLVGRDYQTFRARGGSMVWSPLSNLLLYGGTADIARAAREKLPVALGSDWSPSGSKNLLAELKVAWLVSEARGGVFTPEELVAMATVNPARILKWQDVVGTLEAGKRADIVAVAGRGGDAYEHLLRARESAISLVVIDGAARYGQPTLMARLAAGTDNFENRTVGGADRVIDLTDALADPLVGALTLGEAESRLAEGLRTLPELARTLENPLTAGALLGASDGTSPGVWFLELDQDERDGLADRHAFGDGLSPFALGAAEALSEVLTPLGLDPLTVVDDDGYIDRLAGVPELSPEAEVVVKGLARLYGRQAPTFAAPSRAAAPAPGPGVRSDVDLAAAAAGRAPAARLADFLDAVGDGSLTMADRITLVDQAMLMIDRCYVHLVLKRAMHAIDPVQRLRLLRARLVLLDEDSRGSEVAFHREMADIFTSLRDLHTNYLLPAPFASRTAYLPFLLERYVNGTGAHYIVSKVAASLAHPTFVPKVEVLHWNGTPIDRAVRANARRQAGSNESASFARGLDAMTIRSLVRSLPPEDDWVVVTYRGLDGDEREIRLDWLVAVAGPGGDSGTGLGNLAAQGVDIQVEAVNEAKKLMFAPAAEAAALDIADPATPTTRAAVAAVDVPTSMPTVFRARPVTTPSGTFGHIRIFTFNVPDAEPFVTEFVRLAGALPAAGLIVDVRGNGGGLIYAAERLLQVLTPREITPEPAQMTTTPLMLDMCARHSPSPLDPTFDLGAWVPSLRQAVATGAQYSNAFPITGAASANARGQRYHGPVVLVTNGLCYSATDIFSAGFQDHGIGPVLGVDGNTGAGGANVWTHDLLRTLMSVAPGGGAATDNPFVDLPGGAGFRAAVRRTLRVGALRGGTPVEDLGIEPDQRHELSEADLMEDNKDLLAAAGALLAAAPACVLGVSPEVRPDGRVRLRLTTAGLDRVDVALDGRPVASLDVADRTTTHTVKPLAPSPSTLDVTGWSGGEVVARRREPL